MREPTADIDNDEELLCRIGEFVRQSVPDEAVEADVAAAGARLALAVGRRPRVNRAVVFVGGAVVASAAAVLLWFVMRPAALVWHATNTEMSTDDYVSAPLSGPPAEVVFSDGTRFELAPGGRGRVAEARANGARFVVENGRVLCRVVHSARAKWDVEAGPYTVEVTGTSFEVQWSGAEQVFDLKMIEGGAVVRGPLAQGGLLLHKAEHVVARLREGQLAVEDGVVRRTVDQMLSEGEGISADEPSVMGTDASFSFQSGVGGSTARVSKGSDRAAGAASWSAMVASGNFAGVVEEATRKGVGATLAEASLSDLAALGDAARYTGRVDLARQVLTAQRTRFPRSREARSAAFYLGRLADDAERSPSNAILWYDRYLAEAPQGSFAAEALGRKMVALHRMLGVASARPIAEAYLSRYPAGAHAAAARQILQTP